MPPAQGYQRAKDLLKEHFSSEHKIAAAYMDKVFAWSVIKSEDVKALQAFSLFLRDCCNAMLDGGNECCFQYEDQPSEAQRQVEE